MINRSDTQSCGRSSLRYVARAFATLWYAGSVTIAKAVSPSGYPPASDYGRATPSLRHRRPTSSPSEQSQPPQHSHLDCRATPSLLPSKQSGEFHDEAIWDSTARGDGRLLLTVEHRSAPAPDPVLLRLHGGGHQPLALRLDGRTAVARRGGATLQKAAGPLSRTALRHNACASTSPVSAMLCSNWNNAASPCATATAGACRTDRPHADARPPRPFLCSAPRTHSERNAASDRQPSTRPTNSRLTHQMSAIPADRDSSPYPDNSRLPDRGTPIYQIAGADTCTRASADWCWRSTTGVSAGRRWTPARRASVVSRKYMNKGVPPSRGWSRPWPSRRTATPPCCTVQRRCRSSVSVLWCC